MAKQKAELELDDTEKKGGAGKIIIIAVVALLLIGGSVGGTLFFTGALSGGGEGEQAQQAQAPVVLPANYFELKPEFVINFEGEQKASYLQVEIQVMTRNPAVLPVLEAHMPLIRNNVLLILSGQQYQPLTTLEGKEKLRSEILEAVQEVVVAEFGEPAIESLFFTNFIMQ